MNLAENKQKVCYVLHYPHCFHRAKSQAVSQVSFNSSASIADSWGPADWYLPEHHHVDGVVSEAGNQRCQGDDKHDRKQEVGTAVAAGAGRSGAPADAAAVCIGLDEQSREVEKER